MKKIYLTQGKVASVDDDSFEELNQYKWCAARERSGWYAVRSTPLINGKRDRIRMHRFILDAPKGVMVDHINGDTLDNRKSNLRFATAQQNQWNKRPKLLGASKYKGVTRDKRRSKWAVKIRLPDRSKRLTVGHFDNELDAAIAYDNAAIALFGVYARTNFGNGE